MTPQKVQKRMEIAISLDSPALAAKGGKHQFKRGGEKKFRKKAGRSVRSLPNEVKRFFGEKHLGRRGAQQGRLKL